MLPIAGRKKGHFNEHCVHFGLFRTARPQTLAGRRTACRLWRRRRHWWPIPSQWLWVEAGEANALIAQMQDGPLALSDESLDLVSGAGPRKAHFS